MAAALRQWGWWGWPQWGGSPRILHHGGGVKGWQTPGQSQDPSPASLPPRLPSQALHICPEPLPIVSPPNLCAAPLASWFLPLLDLQSHRSLVRDGWSCSFSSCLTSHARFPSFWGPFPHASLCHLSCLAEPHMAAREGGAGYG